MGAEALLEARAGVLTSHCTGGATTLPDNLGAPVARIGFGLGSLASLGFLVWFIAAEMTSPGLSYAAALIGMPLLATLFGFSKVKGKAIAKDGKAAGWVAFVIALLGVGYVATFFGSWLPIAGLWLGLQLPMLVATVTSPTAEG